MEITLLLSLKYFFCSTHSWSFNSSITPSTKLALNPPVFIFKYHLSKWEPEFNNKPNLHWIPWKLKLYIPIVLLKPGNYLFFSVA